MARLNDEVKQFIVQALACFDSPSEVAEKVFEEFGVEIPRQQVQVYDPTKEAGRVLSKKYVEVFHATRKAYLEDIRQIPIAHQSFRLHSLQRMHDSFVNRKNYIAAQSVLEQAAKEVGGLFTNKMQHGGDAQNSLAEFLKQISGSSIPVVNDISNIVDD